MGSSDKFLCCVVSFPEHRLFRCELHFVQRYCWKMTVCAPIASTVWLLNGRGDRTNNLMAMVIKDFIGSPCHSDTWCI
jgi:hypothetical protein